ncbi:hypothetical protein Tco_0953833 [Tanacetum coccineum]|uniref:Uncharacterized protein n=1 Tax=Tanacetum coccineum TaxID=301880 RepID=A0ABQ5E3C2_9ASTR
MNLSSLVKQSGKQDLESSFDETKPIPTFDFSAFGLNRLNVQTLTPELLAGPNIERMKGTCKSLTELDYFCEERLRCLTAFVVSTVVKYGTNSPSGVSALGVRKRRQFYALQTFKESARERRWDDDASTIVSKEGDLHRLRSTEH